jgi:hypothetical protein
MGHQLVDLAVKLRLRALGLLPVLDLDELPVQLPEHGEADRQDRP